MIEKLQPSTVITIKKYGYLIAPISILLIPLSLYLGTAYHKENLFAFFVPFAIYCISPIFDYLIGKDPTNLDDPKWTEQLNNDHFYRFITYMAVPLVLVNVAFGVHIFVTYDAFNWLGKIGWIWSVGSMSAYIGINSGHELIHKNTKLERRLGSLLMSMVCYSGFKVEHVRCHHVHAATPIDNSYVPRNRSIYSYLPHCISHNIISAWKLEKKRLNKLGLSAFHYQSELIWWYLFSLGVFVTCFVSVGWLGVLFFALQSLIAVMTLETVGYIEHYGLTRKQRADGQYEKMTLADSWDCPYLLTNLYLLHLPRHPEHHTNPGRRYQILSTHPESPQLPGGYAILVFLAYFPPLFFAWMNPVIDRFYHQQGRHEMKPTNEHNQRLIMPMI